VHAPIEADARLGWNEEDSVRMLIENTRGIDLALCGHSARGGSLSIANQDGKATPVLSVGDTAENIARVDIRMLSETKQLDLQSEVLALSSFPLDIAGRSVLQEMLQPVEAQLAVKLGTVKNPVPYEPNRQGNSAWMDMIHGSQIWAAREWAEQNDADLPGEPLSIAYSYLELPAGESLPAEESLPTAVQVRELCRLAVDTPCLSLLLVSGEELYAFLDELALSVLKDERPYSLSGLHYSLNPEAPAGQRVTRLTHPDGAKVEHTDVFPIIVAERGEPGSLLLRYLDEDWMPAAERHIPFEIPDMPGLTLRLPSNYEACRLLACHIRSSGVYDIGKEYTKWSLDSGWR